MSAFLSSPLLASLQDAARFFVFSGGVALFVRSSTGYSSCKPSACAAEEARVLAVTCRRPLVRCAHPDNELSGLPEFDAARFLEVTS